MNTRGRLSGLCTVLVWWLIALHIVAADDQVWSPKITTSEFPNVNNILHFEDSPKLLLHSRDEAYFSEDSGESWSKLPLVDENGDELHVTSIQEFTYQPNAAMVFTSAGKVMYTFDQGESWDYIDFPVSDIILGKAQINYANNDYLLFKFLYFANHTLAERTFYSKDKLKTLPTEVEVENVGECTFTKINPVFTQGTDEHIICISKAMNSFNVLQSADIVMTDDFFGKLYSSSDAMLDNMNVREIKIVKSFVIAAVSTDRYLVDSSVLYTSKDGVSFYKAFFEDQEKGWMFSILGSTLDSLYVSVYERQQGHDVSASNIYRSDSEGRYFKKIFGDVFSNILGMSLISKVETLDGVWIASHNVEYNGMQVPKSKSMITFDDGENWNYLNITDSETCKNDDECSVHIAWLTQRAGNGDLVTGETPGIQLGVGNVGKYLEHSVDKLKTFVSRDGGLSWQKVSDTPSVFAFGDLGNILITVPINLEYFMKGSHDKAAESISYSLDQGQTWIEVHLPSKFIPLYFVNNKDNTDETFALLGIEPENKQFLLHVFNFQDAFDKTCTESDMEEWLPRVDPKTKEQVCVYGLSEKFIRRKPDSKCFLNMNYKNLEVFGQPCVCTIKDSECNSGFKENENGECEPVLPILAQYCESSKTSVKLSTRRITPGNWCQNGYKPPTNDYTLSCKDALAEKKLKAVSVKFSSFKENIMYYQYLNKNATKFDFQAETLIVLTASRKAYISYDGDNFSELWDKSILYLYTNPYWPDSFHLISDTGEIVSSMDRGYSFEFSEAPHVSTGYSSYGMSFDSKSPYVHILYSHVNCDASNNCEVYASITEDNGNSYNDLKSDIKQCVFAESVFDAKHYDYPETEIICSQSVTGESYYRLISTTDGFASEPKVLFEKIIGFTTTGKYMVVAELTDKDSLTAHVSVNGRTFAEVHFPQDLTVERQSAYTILDVNSDELFMHLTTSDTPDQEYGALLKANYNGTLLTTAINYVNRNSDAFVDFESVQGLEGLSLVNVVINPEEVKNGAEKKLVTKISHSDAATWLLLTPPSRDSQGKTINCKGCSLHLHSYTERLDPSRDSFSSGSAIGMMFGLGNVGTSLSSLDDHDIGLYFTKDAGISWKEIAKGHYIWEFGDQGTILVIVQTSTEVDTLKYSLDLGETWIDYQFSPDKKYLVEDIATVPSDNSLKFILIVKDEDVSNSIISVDFTNIYSRQCVPLHPGEPSDDYEYFVPKHPTLKSSCLFGHETLYLRRKANRDCFIGREPLYLRSSIVHNCECTREDYECDYNFELAIDGTCKLVKGLKSLKGDEVCSTGDVNEWWEPTGYRKLEQSTCHDGVNLDKWNSHPCPGKESEKASRGGWPVFWFSFLEWLSVFTGLFIFVYGRGIRRNGGFSRLREIRLDEDNNLQLIEENKFDKVVNTIVRFGVFSFQLMSKVYRTGLELVDRATGRNSSNQNNGSIGAFFNDMVDDDHSLFGDLNDDEDAREIDSFLERGNHDSFDEFTTSHEGNGYRDEPSSAGTDEPILDADNSEFRLSDDHNDN
ncbi:hypothetical protein PMKS-003971 [Pichia membranifaciens]|uniref:VPS10 domain-containing protein n=1 Tax=Pichia membranifaciens TaxID=4926 RepID=A0A1Q2YLS2_9ASCO|nr:hypothetical protein PMKS-003971 [Pichia membranifaciens]